MMGGGNMQQLARQAQKLQQQMTKMQEELEAREYEASAGGGMVNVRAVNEALRTASDTMEREMSKVTGGLSMPGLF